MIVKPIKSTRFSESGMQYIRERAGKLTNVIAAEYLQWAADQGEFRLPENWERQVPAIAREISAGEIGVKTWLQWIVRIPRTISPREFSSYQDLYQDIPWKLLKQRITNRELKLNSMRRHLGNFAKASSHPIELILEWARILMFEIVDDALGTNRE